MSWFLCSWLLFPGGPALPLSSNSRLVTRPGAEIALPQLTPSSSGKEIIRTSHIERTAQAQERRRQEEQEEKNKRKKNPSQINLSSWGFLSPEGADPCRGHGRAGGWAEPSSSKTCLQPLSFLRGVSFGSTVRSVHSFNSRSPGPRTSAAIQPVCAGTASGPNPDTQASLPIRFQLVLGSRGFNGKYIGSYWVSECVDSGDTALPYC